MAGRSWKGMLALAVGVLTVAGMPAPSRGASPLEMNFYLSGPNYSSDVPLCSEHGPLDRIQYGFHLKEDRFWHSDLRIVDFTNVREIAWRPWVSGTIPRRFCRADAIVTDGRRHAVYYSIIEDGGLMSMSYGVEWCVVGFDRNWAYNPRCKEAGP